MKRSRLFLLALFAQSTLSFAAPGPVPATAASPSTEHCPADMSPWRRWWNVIHYDINIKPDYHRQSIEGINQIRFQVLTADSILQIDLAQPLTITSIQWGKHRLSIHRKEGAYIVVFPSKLKAGTVQTIIISYGGRPGSAKRPPWDSGWIWAKDRKGRPWMSVACEGSGASIWLPCKDVAYDEPDSGMDIHITVADTLVAVANGRLIGVEHLGPVTPMARTGIPIADARPMARTGKPIAGARPMARTGNPIAGVDPEHSGTSTYHWRVVNPINNYDIIPYIGKYVTWHENYAGLKGNLDCDYWVLDYNLDLAQQHFRQVDTMLPCFESWMGPYPFYEDGYKLVEAPMPGMEHQSGIAYGNGFQNSYLGKDLSHTGWGLKWDFILVHESGHEWFGNSISSAEQGESWIHEGFTKYLESLYTAYVYGAQAGNEYAMGINGRILNDAPVIGSGSSDQYNKGSAMLHMINIILGDSAFRQYLIGLNKTFYHQTVSTVQILDYLNTSTGQDFTAIFDQYLKTTMIPCLAYRFSNGKLCFRWTHCVGRFRMPVRVMLQTPATNVPGTPIRSPNTFTWIYPTEQWQTMAFTSVERSRPSAQSGIRPLAAEADSLKVDPNFYVQTAFSSH